MAVSPDIERPVRVCDLVAGDKVTCDLRSAVFICHLRHPLWPSLELVIWKMDDGTYSFDALRIDQEVGTIDPGDTVGERKSRLLHALLGGRPAAAGGEPQTLLGALGIEPGGEADTERRRALQRDLDAIREAQRALFQSASDPDDSSGTSVKYLTGAQLDKLAGQTGMTGIVVTFERLVAAVSRPGVGAVLAMFETAGGCPEDLASAIWDALTGPADPPVAGERHG